MELSWPHSREPMRRVPQSRPDLAGALDSIRRVLRVLRRGAGQSERELGIGSAQLFVLQQLAERPAASVNELAARTYTHQSSVSVVVRRLVAQGLVSRRRASEDGRRRELSLTAAGRRLVARAPVPAQVRLIEGLSRLTQAEIATLRRLLGKVVIEMGAAHEPPTMFFSESGRIRRSREPI
jgi:DNA-binding MarR family transcriptional regulator